jgi:hypothetical protein
MLMDNQPPSAAGMIAQIWSTFIIKANLSVVLE